MARRVIGLDVGTNAVRVAEVELGETIVLRTFGQVALPLEAMREGEVLEPAEVTAAIRRLFKELGLKRGEVRVGIAGPRVIVRPVDLPAMSESELAGALRFQAQELIPIPLEEAVLDFQVLEALEGPEPPRAGPTDATQPTTAAGGEPAPAMRRVLLAAAHRETVQRLVGAVRAAGLRISAVDLVPLALIRSLGRRVSANGEGAEAIVSVGGGVTAVVVHEAGLPRFVRMLGTGGRALTDAIARELEVSTETAEALKRQGGDAPDDLAPRIGAALERPLADLIEEIRSSIDYYRTQPDAARLLDVVLTGGAAQQEGLSDGLARVLGIPVTRAEPRDGVTMGDVGFAPDELDALDPYLPVPIGLALGGAATGKRINLLGAERAGPPADVGRLVAVAAGALVVLAAVLGLLTYQKQQAVSKKKDEVVAQERENSRLQSGIDRLAGAAASAQQIDALGQQVSGLLTNDVSWARLLSDISRTLPADVWLTNFTGTVSGTGAAATPAPAPSTTTTTRATTTSGTGATTTTTAPGGATPPGATSPSSGSTVTFTAYGLDFTSVASWLQKVAAIPSFTNLWVPNSSRSTFQGQSVVTFSSTATLTGSANSGRAKQYTGQP